MFKLRLAGDRLPKLLLLLCILGYTAYFSWYTINRHNTLNSYAADLSLIDQPMWNTALGPGGFMEQTWGHRQQPRLAEHFEPILVPLSFLFFLWNDVRLLLIAQSAALAIGALPVFWITQYQLSINNYQLTKKDNRQGDSSHFAFANWTALGFGVAYLLYPQLQAANIADFHADPFVVAPLLFAFWYAIRQRWRWMWVWAIIAMLAKETLPTLTAMLGLYLVADFIYTKYFKDTNSIVNPKLVLSEVEVSKIVNGAALFAVSTAWFFIATFLIVSPLAQQHFGTDGPIYLTNRFEGGVSYGELLQEPQRWRYLAGLLAPLGFLSLLAPEMLLLGLPVLAANMFSNFPGQFSGEQHYSAPLVAVFVLAAIYGVRRLMRLVPQRETNRQTLAQTSLIAATLWLAAWLPAMHATYGWTPVSTRTENYRMEPAAQKLPQLLPQIPDDAAVTASAAIHPHLAHRQKIYVFPTVADAGYLLVDVTDVPGAHPNDARAQLLEMLDNGWQLLAADHGLILARKIDTAQPASLPPEFFSFTRANRSPAVPVSISFSNERLQFLGYDVLDDPDDGVRFRLYWQANGPLPPDLKLWPLVYNDAGALLFDPAQVPMIAAVWNPPETWPAGQVVVTETLPQLLPDTFHLGIATGIGDTSLGDPNQRLPLSTDAAAAQVKPGKWAQLATFYRQGPYLTRIQPAGAFQPLTPVEAQFGPAIKLTGTRLTPDNPRPGDTISVVLSWMTDKPLSSDYTVFIHLLDGDGTRVAQSDAYPTWLTPQPTSQWLINQPILDSHTLTLPDDLSPGSYTLQLGLYNAQTLERLPLSDSGDVFELGQVRVK